ALNQDGLLQDVQAHHLAVAFDRLHVLALVGQAALQIDVGRIFVLEAALETAAHAGQPRRIERQALLARHLDRDRIEIPQPRRAAQFAAAWTDAASDLGL